MNIEAKPAAPDTPLTIGGRTFTARLVTGTGKYADYPTMQRALDASGCEVVTVAVRRERLINERGESLLADVSMESSDEIEWVLDGGTGNVSFEGYRSVRGSSGAAVASGTGLRVLQTGEAHYLLYFTHHEDHPNEPLMVKIYSADQLLLERTLTTAAK